MSDRIRDFVKHVMVSPEVHARLRDHCIELGYKTQYIADKAIEEYLDKHSRTNEDHNTNASHRASVAIRRHSV